MALAYVNPELLVWARTKANLAPDKVSRNFAAARILAWESGAQIPTFAQVEELATKYKVPLLTFFLTEPPTEVTPLTDLRTLRGAARKTLSSNFNEAINDAIVRQDWYREEFPNAKPRILSKQFSIDDDVVSVAEYVRKTLRINDDLLKECTKWRDFLDKLSENAEAAGVLVLRSSLVANNPTRKLDVKEFRGFALTDDVAPLIFINSNDTTTAQVFTLIHEVVHICINQSGISNPDPTKPLEGIRNKTELFCNRVAAEVLVPRQKFMRSWWNSLSNADNLKRIVQHYKVSNMVALRRAYDLDKISADYFFPAVKADYARFKKKEQKDEEKETSSKGGPELWVVFPIRSGRKFTESVFVSLQGGKVSHIDAARLLGLSVPTLEVFAKRRAA